jgi:hypothetical protein
MANEDNTVNALKFLPIEVTREYFHSLPEDIIHKMYQWFIGEQFDYNGYHTKEQRADYLYACFEIIEIGPDSDTYFYSHNQLKFYIRNNE